MTIILSLMAGAVAGAVVTFLLMAGIILADPEDGDQYEE